MIGGLDIVATDEFFESTLESYDVGVEQAAANFLQSSGSTIFEDVAEFQACRIEPSPTTAHRA